MLSFLLALTRRLRQPTGLAVVMTPLALLVCAMAVQALGSAERLGIQMQAIAQHGDYRDRDSLTNQLRVINATGVAADKADCRVPEAARPLGKSQLARRIAERWAPSLFIGFRASSFEPSLVAGPTMPKVFDASSPEYLTLRQLRL